MHQAIVALQKAAYAANRVVLGREPLPLLVDYDEIFATHECWVRTQNAAIVGAMFLRCRDLDLLIWSIASDPRCQGKGLGRAMLAAAEHRARELDRKVIRLYTGQKLTDRVAWYSRHGYMVENFEMCGDLKIVHMRKDLE